MLTRAVFSEGDAARPITASQPPGRARKTSKHYRSRWQGRSYSAADLRGKAARATGSPGHGCGAEGVSRLHLVCAASRPFPGSISKSIGWLALGGLTLIRGHSAERFGENVEQKSLPLVQRLLDTRVAPCIPCGPTSSWRSVERALAICRVRFPGSGYPTGFTVRHTENAFGTHCQNQTSMPTYVIRQACQAKLWPLSDHWCRSPQ